LATREEVKTDENKRNNADFALWFKRVGRFKDHAMHWESPWGDGFPGWHIECSAMSMKYLGEQFDIHTGGEDHIPVHHPNEIAQSEGATNKKPFVKYWVHYSHLLVDGRKMSKSTGNFITLTDVTEKGISPLALRYFYMTAHYKKHMNFTWEALDGAKNTLEKLYEYARSFAKGSDRHVLSNEKDEKRQHFAQTFKDAIENDLNMPEALAVVWETVKSNIPTEDKYDLLLSFDEVLGLNIKEEATKQEERLPEEIIELVTKRDAARSHKNFEQSDALRKELEEKGFDVFDTPTGTQVKRTF
jgi:cysteinyl-tRNA synthetase